MKKILLLMVSVVILISSGCGGGSDDGSSSGPGTSTVTINIGGRASNGVAGAVNSVSAIPSNVVSIRLTVSADDIETIVKVVPVTGGSSVTVSVDVINGPDRHFLVEALDSSGNVLYTGSATADLTGEPLNLAINLKSTTWAKSYGGAGDENAYAIEQTSDGGYIVAGRSSSFTGGSESLWILKVSGRGSVQWEKAYDNAGYNASARSIHQTSDGGYIVAGDDDVCGDGCPVMWIMKLSGSGSVEWQKTYDAGDSRANSIQQTSDGGYIVAGQSNYVFWVLKLNRNGSVAWEKTYSVFDSSGANSVQQTSDGGYIVAGYADLSVDKYFFIMKLSADGTPQWQKSYNNTAYDIAISIQQTSDGGYIVAGISASAGAKVGNSDFWILKLNASGAVQWERTYNGGIYDAAYSVRQTVDGGYIAAGVVNTAGPDDDIWVLKLGSNGSVQWQKRYGGTGIDNAYAIAPTSDGNFIAAGATYTFGAGGSDLWIVKLLDNGFTDFNASSGAAVHNTSAAVSNTSAVVSNANATVSDTSATVMNSNAAVTNTNAAVDRQGP